MSAGLLPVTTNLLRASYERRQFSFGNPQKLRDGFYSELHIRLPMSEMDRKTFNAPLEILGPTK